MKSSKQISIVAFLSLLVLTGCTNDATPGREGTPSSPVSQDAPLKQTPEKIPPVTNIPETIAPKAIAPVPKTATVTKVPATSTEVTETKELSYTSPAGPESIKVSITTQNGIITNVMATPLATAPISLKLQTAFADNVSKSVVGKNLKGLKVDTVSGASLTTEAFNEFLASSN